MRKNVVKQRFEPYLGLIETAAKLGAALVLLAAVAPSANASQDAVNPYQPQYVPGRYPYAARYYGAISPYPIGFYSYPNYVYPGSIGGYSVGYYPYAFPPPYRAPLWPYGYGLYGYGGWGYGRWGYGAWGYGGLPYGAYSGWGGAYPYGFGF